MTGKEPNTFRGSFTLTKGVLDLDKPDDVDAIPGDLVVGVQDAAWIRLAHSDQIGDPAHVTLAGPALSGIDLQGHREQFASQALVPSRCTFPAEAAQ